MFYCDRRSVPRRAVCAQTLDGSFGAMLAAGAGGIVSLAIPAYGRRAGIMIFIFLIVSNPGMARRILYL